MKRRKFIKAGTILPAVGLTAQSTWESRETQPDSMVKTIVFQGDSITDAGRDRGNYYANQGRGMGQGYVYQIVSELLGAMPDERWQCYNRGISGHKVFQLADRWDIDCLYLKPEILSILIGVNDYWHGLNGRYDGTAETYEDDFRKLLLRTKEALPEVKLMIGEPFAVAGGTAIDDRWQPFDAYRSIAKELALEFDAAFIPYHSVFAEALSIAPVEYWCPDGVHPSIAGAHLMKKAWMEAFKSL